MAEDATPLVEALVAIIDAARAYLRRTGSARTSSSPGCSRRPTIRELSRRSQCMVIRWRGTRPGRKESSLSSKKLFRRAAPR